MFKFYLLISTLIITSIIIFILSYFDYNYNYKNKNTENYINDNDNDDDDNLNNYYLNKEETIKFILNDSDNYT